MNFKKAISGINSWNDFKEFLKDKSKLEKGNAFEELTKYYLSYNPVYKSKLKTVWLQKEIPSSVLKKLNLPSSDQGIDLVAETFDGNYWAIQCKYFHDEAQKLSHKKISTFISLSKGIAENISYCLVCTTVDEYAELYKGKKNIGFCNSDDWNKLDKDFFGWLRNKLKGKEKSLIAYQPKPHQKRAITEAKNYFNDKKSKRGKLVFPCGAGKSLTGYWITKELNAKNILVAVPSLSLVKQMLEVYLRETIANKESVEWLCVCSDESIGKNDDIVIHTQDLGVPCVTDKKFIVDWLKKHKNKKTIIFTTYQSGKTIAEVSKIVNFKFDLGILDEAHKTVGAKDKLFSYLLFDKNISISKRIFMTATERRYAGSSETILSMDDEDVYGETFSSLSFKEAIETEILSDYKIITLFISDSEVKQLIQKNAFVKPIGKEWSKETEARTLASLIALRKAMDKYPIHHAVTFHSSITKSKSFEESQELFSNAYPEFSKVDSFHVSGAMPTSVRSKIVNEFASSKKAIITNSKCLTEGIDVPKIDCVLFADPRKSTIDIVQAVGRALRKREGKTFGYVLLPVFTKSKTKESVIEIEEFNEVLTTLRALASNDERITEYFSDISRGKKINTKDSPITFEVDEQLADLINADELVKSLQLLAWNKLAKLSFRLFEEAREFIRSLKLKDTREWLQYRKSNRRPFDIPSNPNRAYKNNGWISMYDWLGNGRIAIEFLPFEEARKFIRSLNLKGETDWLLYCRSGKKPNNIPFAPRSTYKELGWISMSDWLGNGRGAVDFLAFKEARKFVHSLNLKSNKEWRKYLKSDKKSKNISTTPERFYKKSGWINWGDWLGTNVIGVGLQEYRSFNDARKFVWSLKLKSQKEWMQYSKSDKKPKDIPAAPWYKYKNDGWVSMGDWLGTGTVATFLWQYRSFEEARDFVRSLNFKNLVAWNQYCNSGNKPKDIPAFPNQTYKNKGWKGYGDFLGTGTIANFNKVYLTFNEARKFVHQLKLKNSLEWRAYCKSGNKPIGIPTKVNRTYKNEWKGWIDFLGTKIISNTKE